MVRMGDWDARRAGMRLRSPALSALLSDHAGSADDCCLRRRSGAMRPRLPVGLR